MKQFRAKKLQEAGSWWTYLKDFTILLPYLTPRNDRKVQLCLFINLLCLAAQRALNILVPIQLANVTNEILSHESPYKSLALWLLLTLLNSESGVGLIDQLTKIPIKQFSYRQVTNAAFNHVMSLGLEFHSERDSAEVMKSIEQGEVLTNLLETVVIDILPTVVDLFIAFVILYYKFNVYISLVMLIASIAFVSVEVITSNWNIGNRRRVTKTVREETRILHQAVQGWQTVTYFNMLALERRRYGDAIEAHLTADRAWSRRSAYIQAIVESIVPTTFFVLSCLVLYEISIGNSSTGDFVFLIQ